MVNSQSGAMRRERSCPSSVQMTCVLPASFCQLGHFELSLKYILKQKIPVMIEFFSHSFAWSVRTSFHHSHVWVYRLSGLAREASMGKWGGGRRVSWSWTCGCNMLVNWFYSFVVGKLVANVQHRRWMENMKLFNDCAGRVSSILVVRCVIAKQLISVTSRNVNSLQIVSW